MTDKERIEKIYRKIQTKYPDVSSKEEIDNLAIKTDKRNTLLLSMGYFLGAVVCGIIFYLLVVNEAFEASRYLFVIMAGSGVFECFRTLGKYSKIEQRYKPVVNVKYEGHLTRDKIFADGGKVLKNADYIFNIVKLPLYDKEDETDSSINNELYHKYYLHFRLPDSDLPITYNVNRDRYMEAVIGTEYFVVITSNCQIGTVYQASNWSVDSELQMYFIDTASQACSQTVQQENSTAVQTENLLYQPGAVQTNAEPEKKRKLLPILAIALTVLGYFTPIFVGMPMCIAALVIAILGLVKQRTKLSIAAVIVNIVLSAFLVIAVFDQM